MLLLLTFTSDEEQTKFEYLYERYKRLLLHKAYEILGDYALAEDAVSEAYLRVYKNLHKVGHPDAPQSVAFLVTIAKNTALTLRRQQGRHATEEYDDTLPDSFDLEQVTLSGIGAADICGLLDRLGDDLRHAFLLKYACDMSHREIAGVLGISENNATVRIHRARKKLAGLLVKEGYAVEA